MKIEGIEFSHCYKLLIKGDTSSVNLPWITELMANFGVLGGHYWYNTGWDVSRVFGSRF